MSAEIHPFHQFFTSLILGLLVGLQRQWADPPLGGVRTFPLPSTITALGVMGLLILRYSWN